jgi:hypothetical protein
MNTDLLKLIALRSAGGAAGGAALGGYVAPEGSRLEGAGVGALAGGLAGAGSVALGHGTPHVPAEELAEAAHVLETAPFHAVAPGGVKMPPVERLRGTPRAPREPSTSPQGAFYTEAPEHADVYRADVEDAADHFGGLLSQQITGLPRRKTAAYLAGRHAAAAALGLEKEAWAPLIAAGARMLPMAARGLKSLAGVGNAASKAMTASSTAMQRGGGIQRAATSGWKNFQHNAPNAAKNLQTAGRVAANPVVQTGAMMAAM